MSRYTPYYRIIKKNIFVFLLLRSQGRIWATPQDVETFYQNMTIYIENHQQNLTETYFIPIQSYFSFHTFGNYCIVSQTIIITIFLGILILLVYFWIENLARGTSSEQQNSNFSQHSSGGTLSTRYRQIPAAQQKLDKNLKKLKKLSVESREIVLDPKSQTENKKLIKNREINSSSSSEQHSEKFAKLKIEKEHLLHKQTSTTTIDTGIDTGSLLSTPQSTSGTSQPDLITSQVHIETQTPEIIQSTTPQKIMPSFPTSKASNSPICIIKPNNFEPLNINNRSIDQQIILSRTNSEISGSIQATTSSASANPSEGKVKNRKNKRYATNPHAKPKIEYEKIKIPANINSPNFGKTENLKVKFTHQKATDTVGLVNPFSAGCQTEKNRLSVAKNDSVNIHPVETKPVAAQISQNNPNCEISASNTHHITATETPKTTTSQNCSTPKLVKSNSQIQTHITKSEKITYKKSSTAQTKSQNPISSLQLINQLLKNYASELQIWKNFVISTENIILLENQQKMKSLEEAKNLAKLKNRKNVVCSGLAHKPDAKSALSHDHFCQQLDRINKLHTETCDDCLEILESQKPSSEDKSTKTSAQETLGSDRITDILIKSQLDIFENTFSQNNFDTVLQKLETLGYTNLATLQEKWDSVSEKCVKLVSELQKIYVDRQ